MFGSIRVVRNDNHAANKSDINVTGVTARHNGIFLSRSSSQKKSANQRDAASKSSGKPDVGHTDNL